MLTEKEKEFLKSRINTSIVEHNRKRKKRKVTYFFGMAAAMISVLLLSIVYQNKFTKTSKIKNYVDANKVNLIREGDVKLVLHDNKEINIQEKESNIEYSSTGDQVNINSSEKVAQVAKESYNTILVPYGKRTKLTLSDGTKVWLNSGSKLTYPVAFVGNKREVHLTGEAIFDVRHNQKKPFYVLTNDYDIKVLGTVFNVSSYEDDSYTSTALERGSVEIKYTSNSIFGNSKIKIKPGTLAVYSHKNKTIRSSNVDVAKYMSWREGKFIFKKERLSGIVKKLSRFYNVQIVINDEDLKNETFSGHLDLKDSIEKVIEIIKETTDLKYEKENGKIVIN